MQIPDDRKKGLYDGQSFIGAYYFYRHHMHKCTYLSAPLTDLTKKNKPSPWIDMEEACFQEFKKKITSSNCLWITEPQGRHNTHHTCL